MVLVILDIVAVAELFKLPINKNLNDLNRN